MATIDIDAIKMKVENLAMQIRDLLDGSHPIGEALTIAAPLKVDVAETIRNTRLALTYAEDEILAREKLVDAAKADFKDAQKLARNIKANLKNLMDLDKTLTSGVSDAKKLFEVTGEV